VALPLRVPAHRLTVVPVDAPPVIEGDGVTIRPPEPADAARVATYAAGAEGLTGRWLPLGGPLPTGSPWPTWFVHELGLGWTPLGGRFGGGLVIDTADVPFAGLLNCAPGSAGVLSLDYGVAPAQRGRGIATAATIAVTEWALTSGFSQVELEISSANDASIRVATKGGFTLAGRYPRTVLDTGERYEVLRMRRAR
jgi:RimJ/RimL family protein N-acetyltransferase